MGRWKNKVGFTLIELLVVVIIVAVLAAVGLPLLTGNVERARLSEADAGLGAVRTGMRALLAEKASYASASGLTPIAANIGLKAGDLNGRFFDDDDYLSLTAGATTFCSVLTGSGNTTFAKRANQVAGLSRAIDQDGHIYADAGCGNAAKIVN